MEDLEPTQPVPKRGTSSSEHVTDSQMRNLHALAKDAFETRHSVSRGIWDPPTLEEMQRQLPQYEVMAFLARGGMGAVYRAIQRTLKREVAIKVLPPGIEDGDMQFAERFKQEAQAMARLSHPNIVAVHDAGETADGLLYFVMEYIEGTDVARLIASEGKIAPAQAVPIITAVCEALAFAHEEGIIHRDIKPSNIMLDRKGRVKVADFGLAKAVNVETSLMTRSDVAMGTPDFIAPEALITGMKVDGRADIYAVGVMLYQMLTGQVPRGRFDPPSELVPQVDAAFDDIVDKAMQTDRERRYSTATDMKRDVESVALEKNTASKATATHLDEARTPSVNAHDRHPQRVLFIAAAVAIGIGGFLWMQRQSEAPTSAPSSQILGNHPAWQKLYTLPEDLVPFHHRPTMMVSKDDQRARILENPKAALRMENGWVVPASGLEIKLPLPIFTNMGVRLRARRIAGGSMDTASIWLRTNGQSGGLAAGWRGITLYPGKAGGKAEPLLYRKNLVPVQIGEEFSLDFYCIGNRFFSRYQGELVEARHDAMMQTNAYLLVGQPVTSVEVIKLDGLSEAEALKLVGLSDSSPSVEHKPKRPTWQKFYTRVEELTPLFKRPGDLYIYIKERPELFQNPQAGLRIENGWLVPTVTAKIPLPTAKNAGLRMRAKRVAGTTGRITLCLRTDEAGREYQSTWAGIVRQNGKASESPIRLGKHENAQEAVPGEEFILEFYAIGNRLISRYKDNTLTAVDHSLQNPQVHFTTEIPVTDIEFMNLDGLGEIEAMKLAGVSEADFKK